jgi:phage FluMu gp28-like protein
MLEMLPITRGQIDRLGIGMELAENFEADYGDRASGITFTVERKDLWATRLKIAMQHSQVVLIPNRDQSGQLHAARRVITDSKNIRYEQDEDTITTGSGKKRHHHLDKFWAVALAVHNGLQCFGFSLQGASEGKERQTEEIHRTLATKGWRSHNLGFKSKEIADRLRGKMGR